MQALPSRSVETVCGWAIKTRLVRPDLEIQRHRRGTSPRMSAADQEQAVNRVVHTDELTAQDRAAAILVHVFGQQIEGVVGLTWNDVDVTEDLVAVRIGAVEIVLPDPLDEPWRELAATPGNDLTAAHPNSNWVFRGYSPGPPHRSRTPPDTTPRRIWHTCRATWNTPRADQARTGRHHRRGARLSPATIERHAVDSAAAYARYVVAVRDT